MSVETAPGRWWDTGPEISRGRARRYLRDPLEFALIAALYGFFWLLPLDAASWLGGSIARALGPSLPVSNIARRNLRRVMPERDAAEIEHIVAGVWDNLGRTFAEYPHLPKIMRERLEVVGAEHLARMRDDGAPGICFSGHFANWEVMPIYALEVGCPLTILYRQANNPLVDRILAFARRGAMDYFVKKGSKGARIALARLNDGQHLAMLLDQKMNDGIDVPFFGLPARTAPATAQFALRYRCPVLPAYPERVGGARFRLTIEPPLEFAPSGDRQADILAFMTMVNHRLESWIRTRPEQWMWLHRRWPKDIV